MQAFLIALWIYTLGYWTSYFLNLWYMRLSVGKPIKTTASVRRNAYIFSLGSWITAAILVCVIHWYLDILKQNMKDEE